MEFFSPQESLTTVEWILRAIVGFIFFVIIAKLMGRRSMSEVSLLDFVIVLLIGNIIAHPLSDEGLGLKGSMLTMGCILILYLIGVLLSLRSSKIRNLLVSPPLTLIEDGKIFYKNMKKARISIDDLLSRLRIDKVEDIQKVSLALWEPNGSISIFLKSGFKPLTPSTIDKPIEPFQIPKTIIKEGKINFNELELLGKDEAWLFYKLKTSYQVTKIKDILLATIDKNEHINIFLYHNCSK